MKVVDLLERAKYWAHWERLGEGHDLWWTTSVQNAAQVAVCRCGWQHHFPDDQLAKHVLNEWHKTVKRGGYGSHAEADE